MKIMKKNQGFTLIELLAVIVILAVIALITTPVILGVIDKAKKGALQDSAYGLIDSANLYYAEKMLENNNEKLDFTFSDGIQTSTEKLSFKGNIEGTGSLKLYKDGKSAICINEGKYYAIKNVLDSKVTSGRGSCKYDEITEEYLTTDLVSKEELDKLQNEMEILKNKHKEELLIINEDYYGKLKTIEEAYNTNLLDINNKVDKTIADVEKLKNEQFNLNTDYDTKGISISVPWNINPFITIGPNEQKTIPLEKYLVTNNDTFASISGNQIIFQENGIYTFNSLAERNVGEGTFRQTVTLNNISIENHFITDGSGINVSLTFSAKKGDILNLRYSSNTSSNGLYALNVIIKKIGYIE